MGVAVTVLPAIGAVPCLATCIGGAIVLVAVVADILITKEPS